MNTVIFKMDNQQGPCVAQESLLNVMCQPGWEGILGENGCMYMYACIYPLHYSWASLVAQLVKNPPAMRETWVRSLSWEDPLQKGKATQSSILA